MAIRQIRQEGEEILRKAARPISEVTPRIRQQLDDMLETMYRGEGIGLAGPQVGILRRMIVLDVGEGARKMLNPEVLEASSEEGLAVEGCLSIPNFNGVVARPKHIRVRYMDEEGAEKELEANDLFARCILHEIDHLDGVLFRDRVKEVVDMAHITREQVADLQSRGVEISVEEPEPEKEGQDGEH